MKKYLLKLLVRWYIKENREIVKLTIGEEFNLFQFRNSEDTVKLIKSIMTAQTLWHFESNNKDEQNIVKGAALILKILSDGHKVVNNIIEIEEDDNKRYKLWGKYKEKKKDFRVN